MTEDSSTNARRELARQQEELILALLNRQPKPESVSLRQVEVASRSLLLKRARSIARMHPDLLVKHGSTYLDLVRGYAEVYPGSHPAGPCADAARFLRYLKYGASTSPCTFRQRLGDTGSWLFWIFRRARPAVHQEMSL